MMKTYIFIFAFCFAIEANCQQSWSWVNSYGLVSVQEYTTANCTDANGTSYIAGIFQDSIIFGNDTLRRPGGGLFITKFDSSGNPIWAMMPDGNNSLEIKSMTLDDAGNFYLAGTLSGFVIFGNDTVSNNQNHTNSFIGKFDSNGNMIWAQQATGTAQNMVYAVAVNSNLEVYITGIYDSSATFDTTFLQGGAFDNIFVAKLDASGNFLWAQSSSSCPIVYVTGIVCDNFDHACITGYFGNSITFGGVTLTGPNQSIFLVKYDGAGNVLWGQKSGGFPSTVYSKCISTDSSGNFYCAGYFNSPIMIIGNDTLVNAGFNDLFLAKYDSIGSFQWARVAGGPDYDEADAIKTDNAGNTYMTGFFRINISFGSTFLFGPNQELYVVKYDSNGNPLWATSATGSLHERGLGIGLDHFNNIYINGDFTSPTSTFGPLTITNTDIFTGSYDIFFARLGEIPTAIDDPEYSQKENLFIYPNPGNGICRVMNEYIPNSTLRIFDVQGRIVNEMTLENDNVVDLKNISSGIYFLQLSSRKGIRNGKLVIQ